MGNRPDTKIPRKWEREWKMAPSPKWPRKWKNGPQNGIWAIFWPFFHFGGHFSVVSGLGPFSIFFLVFASSISPLSLFCLLSDKESDHIFLSLVCFGVVFFLLFVALFCLGFSYFLAWLVWAPPQPKPSKTKPTRKHTHTHKKGREGQRKALQLCMRHVSGRDKIQVQTWAVPWHKVLGNSWECGVFI